ncbi:40S ribosomal protein mrp2, mitochondrial [Gonapodya sp. JEL0774]|nr:40S ribosomal protein mrp2, mitochondrial [Gonapodya sp. JEL0774]
MAPRSWVLRDKIARHVTSEYEVERNALRYLVRNQTIPLPTRMQAGVALASYPRAARKHAIVNRCTETGMARGVVGEYRISRINFRQQALDGLIPGVAKAQW